MIDIYIAACILVGAFTSVFCYLNPKAQNLSDALRGTVIIIVTSIWPVIIIYFLAVFLGKLTKNQRIVIS